jgi:hypothetical protein
MHQVSVVSFSSSWQLFLSILILQLTMMADRGLKKLASSTWLLFPFIKSELFETFSEEKTEEKKGFGIVTIVRTWIDFVSRKCLLCHRHQHPILPHGYCHGWLCGARAPADMSRNAVFYLKIFQRDRLIKESFCSNQQAIDDVSIFQITEVMLKELSMFCNQL